MLTIKRDLGYSCQRLWRKMETPLEKKIAQLQKTFSSASTSEGRYLLLMEWGKRLSAYPSDKKGDAYRVRGCQSELFLYSEKREGKIFFYAQSDALISAGFAALLLEVFNGEAPEDILRTPPKFLEELGLLQALSPGRSHGLAQLYRAILAHAIKK